MIPGFDFSQLYQLGYVSRTGAERNIHDIDNIFVRSPGSMITVDPIPDRTILEDAAAQTVHLTGISSGSVGNQPLRVTASSDNTDVIAHPTVNYNSPASTGMLQFTPVADAFGTPPRPPFWEREPTATEVSVVLKFLLRNAPNFN